VSKFMNMRFEPAGMTDDEEIRFSTSIVDYLARKLAIEYLPFEKRAELGIHTLEERNRILDEGYGDQETLVPATPSAEAVANAEPVPPFSGSSVPVDHDAPMCFECGIKMKRAGACHVCESCGTTSGCS
jgi:ribonucleoside-diphosphate reductase alpha chain